MLNLPSMYWGSIRNCIADHSVTLRRTDPDAAYLAAAYSSTLGRWVAVGDYTFTTTVRAVIYSDDGDTFGYSTYMSSSTAESMVWEPALSTFVTVNSAGTNRVGTSSDGLTWVGRTASQANPWRGLATNGSIFVAVASSGTNRVMTSPDGITWTNRTASAANQWWGVTWCPGISLFIAVAITGTGTRAMTSPDGITWTTRTSAADSAWKDVTWSASLGLAVAVADTLTTTNQIMTSPDGITWTKRSTPSSVGNLYRVEWSPDASLFVAGGASEFMTSTNGTSWTHRNPKTGTDDTYSYDTGSITWIPAWNKFLITDVSTNGYLVASTTDGITYTQEVPVTDMRYICIAHSPSLAVTVALAGAYDLTDYPIRYTADGVTWYNARKPNTGNYVLYWSSVAWSPELGIFAAVTQDSGAPSIYGAMTSPDGINWTAYPQQYGDTYYKDIVWAPALSKFIGVIAHSTGFEWLDSSNGQTWNAGFYAGLQTAHGITWSEELALAVCVCTGGTGNRVRTSPDGRTWTDRTSAANYTWNAVCWSAELGLFVAVASSGTGNRVMTSSDGLTWTLRTTPLDYSWTNVCWGAERGKFMAVASDTQTNNIMTSTDGITWTAITSLYRPNLLDVTYAHGHCAFIACGDTSGTTNFTHNILTSTFGT